MATLAALAGFAVAMAAGADHEARSLRSLAEYPRELRPRDHGDARCARGLRSRHGRRGRSRGPLAPLATLASLARSHHNTRFALPRRRTTVAEVRGAPATSLEASKADAGTEARMLSDQR